MSKELIIIKQLPIIEQQLEALKPEIEKLTADALSLEVTEESVKEVKKVRADLNARFKALEKRRIEIKTQLSAPYDAMMQKYADCVKIPFDKADRELRDKINEVENRLKDIKTAEVKAYFDEYTASKNIKFLSYDRANINVTLSASLKSLKEEIKAFLDGIERDIEFMRDLEHREEIFVEYKKTLNAAQAFTDVNRRHKAIEEEKARQAEIEAIKAQQEQAAAKVEKVIESAPVVSAPKAEEELITVTFKVTDTVTRLKALKEFLISGGYKYE